LFPSLSKILEKNQEREKIKKKMIKREKIKREIDTFSKEERYPSPIFCVYIVPN
jgi:hypothetical protein